MQISLAFIVIFGVWRWSDWKNWKEYHSTMLLAALGDLLYNFLYCNHFLWIFKPELPIPFKAATLIFTFIILPGSVLWFLSTAPDKLNQQILHILKWVFAYVIIEAALIRLNIGHHNYGWNMWWSMAWDIMMFSVWLLHHKKPLQAYFTAFIVTILFLFLFPL